MLTDVGSWLNPWLLFHLKSENHCPGFWSLNVWAWKPKDTSVPEAKCRVHLWMSSYSAKLKEAHWNNCRSKQSCFHGNFMWARSCILFMFSWAGIFWNSPCSLLDYSWVVKDSPLNRALTPELRLCRIPVSSLVVLSSSAGKGGEPELVM